MPDAWSDKRERQYEHIKSGAKQHGSSDDRASEIAARTVNKNRAQSGESRTASKTSINDVSPQHRGGKRSHSGSGGPTRDQLYNEAKQRGIEGRSSMSKEELRKAVDAKK